MSRANRWYAAAWLAGAIASLAFIVSCTFVVAGSRAITLCDDAMISMRYARNLVETGALSWNAGDAHIEGYTNFLWTLWMAFVHLLPLGELWIGLVIILSGAALIALAARHAAALVRDLGGSSAAPAIVVAATLSCYGLVYWSLRGMEVALLAALVTTGTLQLARRGRLSIVAACAVALVLTRTDAVVFVVVWIAFAVLALRGRERVRVAGVLAAAAIVTLAAHTGFRWAYYGDPLPNTYYLKLGGIPLGTRLLRGTAALFHLLQLGWLVPVVLAGIAFTRREHRPIKVLLACLVVAAAAYSIYVGGDAWEEFDLPNRYLCPALPALFVLAALGIDAIVEAPRRAIALSGALVALAALQLVVPFAPWRIDATLPGATLELARIAAALAFALVLLRRPRVWLLAVVLLLSTSAERWIDWARRGPADVQTDADRVRHGLAIRAATTPDATFATTPAGNIPYFARRRTIDLLGKSDARVAHEPPRTSRFHPGHVKWDYPYSIGQLQPDLVDELFTPREAQLVEADKRAMPAWGYEDIGSNIYVHRGSPRVDVDRLRRLLAR